MPRPRRWPPPSEPHFVRDSSTSCATAFAGARAQWSVHRSGARRCRIAMPWLAMARAADRLGDRLRRLRGAGDHPAAGRLGSSTVFVPALSTSWMAYCWDTLWTTVIGFLLAIAGGLLLGLAIGALAVRLFRPLSAADRLQRDSQGGAGADPDDLGRRRCAAGRHHRLRHQLLPDRGQRRHRASPPSSPRCVTCCAAWRDTRLEILTKVGIPRAMPSSVRELPSVAITLAFIGSVISETVGGNNGIGFLMLSASARNDAPTTFAGLFAIAIMGVLMYAVCALVEKRMTASVPRRRDRGLEEPCLRAPLLADDAAISSAAPLNSIEPTSFLLPASFHARRRSLMRSGGCRPARPRPTSASGTAAIGLGALAGEKGVLDLQRRPLRSRGAW